MECINILYTFNDTYFNPAYISIHSLLAHLSKSVKPNIFVLYSSISNAHQKKLSKLVKKYRGNISFHDCSEFSKTLKFKKTYHFTTEALYRLYYPILLEKLDRLLYIDPDTYISGDVSELYFNTAFRNNEAIACVNHVNEKSLNSGVILFNSEVYSTYVNSISRYAEENYNDFEYPDQEVLNHFFIDSYVHLGPEWNQIINDISVYNLSKGILHFAGSDKPWDDWYYSEILKDLYLSFVKKLYPNWSKQIYHRNLRRNLYIKLIDFAKKILRYNKV